MNLFRWLILIDKYGVTDLYSAAEPEGGLAIHLVCAPGSKASKISRLMRYAARSGIYDKVLPMLTKLETRVVEVL